MKVSELIEEIKNFPAHAKVLVEHEIDKDPHPVRKLHLNIEFLKAANLTGQAVLIVAE